MKLEDEKWMVRSYNGNECPSCDGKKKPKFFFCWKCWKKLPREHQRDIMMSYKHYGLRSQDYFDDMEAAVRELEGYSG